MDIALVSVPFEHDIARWGTARGPEAYLQYGLIERLEQAGHRVEAPRIVSLSRGERTRDAVSNLGRIAMHTSSYVKGLLDEGKFVLTLLGNCTHAVGVAGGLVQSRGPAGMAWFDAHGDLCTMATTETGLWGGMPYAVALGWDLHDWRLAAGLEPPIRPEAAALIGTSDLDRGEEDALMAHPILHMRAAQMDSPAAAHTLREALSGRAGEAAAWYVHIDLDVAGPQLVPGGRTPAPTWPARERLLEAVRASGQALPVAVASLADYNPTLDSEGTGAKFGIDMVTALLEGMRG